MVAAVMPVYAPAPVAPVRGSGMWLYEEDGTAWLDCIGGIAVNALGHCHPAIVSALQAQAEMLWHVGNGLCIPSQYELAQRLIEVTFADTVFFANSGTEAIECAIKAARRYHVAKGNDERVDIVGFNGSFHGRTFAALNAAGNPAYLEGLGPRMAGFHHVDIDDRNAWEKLIALPSIAAVIIEPVQGEGGARAIHPSDLKRLRDATRDHGVLLIHDEVQSGMGRTGRLFAHQWVKGAEPDIMAIAKALGGGFPVSACLATEQAARGMSVGAHGSTFGGNPLAMAVAIAAFDEIGKPATLSNVLARSAQLRNGLEGIARQYPQVIHEIRGKGLLIGVQLHVLNKQFIGLAREEKLLITAGGDNIVRLLPALTLHAQDGGEILERFERACERACKQLVSADARAAA